MDIKPREIAKMKLILHEFLPSSDDEGELSWMIGVILSSCLPKKEKSRNADVSKPGIFKALFAVSWRLHSTSFAYRTIL